MNEPLIIWEKWVDPFGKNIDDAKWTDYTNDIHDISMLNTNQHIHSEEEVDGLSDHEPSYNNASTEDPIRVIASPLGLIPYNEYTASSKIFNFWLGHSNFDITAAIKDAIEKTEGVEILDIFTRYRFRIAVGKCFNDADVMSNINKNVYDIL
jgi:hypothetical protein